MSLSSLSSVDAIASAALLVRDVDSQHRPASADEVLLQARRVLSQQVRRGATMSSPEAVKDYLRVQIGVLEHEVFRVVFLDAQHRIIALKQMFCGTVTQTSVYPREVAKESPAMNDAARFERRLRAHAARYAHILGREAVRLPVRARRLTMNLLDAHASSSITSCDLLSARQSPKVMSQVCIRPGWQRSLMFSCISFQWPGMRWWLQPRIFSLRPPNMRSKQPRMLGPTSSSSDSTSWSNQSCAAALCRRARA